jgi:hypothetical protein
MKDEGGRMKQEARGERLEASEAALYSRFSIRGS